MHAPRGHIAMMQVTISIRISKQFLLSFMANSLRLITPLFPTQIDCEVTNTRLLHIREDSIPPFMSEGNRTEDRRPETGKRAWRKSGKKSQPKVGNFNATSSRNSRGWNQPTFWRDMSSPVGWSKRFSRDLNCWKGFQLEQRIHSGSFLITHSHTQLV